MRRRRRSTVSVVVCRSSIERRPDSRRPQRQAVLADPSAFLGPYPLGGVDPASGQDLAAPWWSTRPGWALHVNWPAAGSRAHVGRVRSSGRPHSGSAVLRSQCRRLPTTRPQRKQFRTTAPSAGYHGRSMANTDLCLDNDAACAELTEIAARLDAASAAYSVGSTWTVATSFCHLAFWDLRALFELKRWQESGSIEAVRLDPQSVASINEAVNMIALQVPAPAAIALAVESAAAVDAFIVTMNEELAERITAAGFQRYLRRSLHRREHLRSIRRALAAQTAKAE